MSSCSIIRALSISALATVCALFPVRALTQTTSTFAEHTIRNSAGNMAIAAHGDFNNDGREDFIVSDANGTGTLSEYIYLSNGDGTYDAPIKLNSVPGAQYVVGDFNHDGKLDFADLDNSAHDVEVWQGHGDGTFTNSDDLGVNQNVVSIMAADVNHDGCPDVVVVDSQGGYGHFQVWKSECNTTTSWSGGQYVTSGVILPSTAVTGDFDGDGKPDLAVIQNFEGPTTIQVWYGDGKGNFASPQQVTDPDGDDDRFDVDANPVGDYNNDGKSDILMYRTKYGLSGTGAFYPQIAVFSGNANRTLTFNTINTSGCPHGIQVADFNGDGLNDVAYVEEPCNNVGGGPDTAVVKPGTGGGAFGAEQTIYNNAYYAGSDMLAVKSTQGTRPDLVLTEWTAANTSPGTVPPQALVLLSNSTTGSSFPACGTANFSEGINVCAPSGSSADSPVNFSISAAGPTPMRTVAVWADGQKVSEQLAHAFSNYSFLDQSVTLSAGTHNITIYGTGWDNILQQKSFTLSVGGSTNCGAPPSPGVNVCKPVNQSTVGSTTEVQATANITGTLARMEIWVDGTKMYTETTSTSLDTNLSVNPGYHTFTIYAVNTAGTKWSSTVHATVGGGNGCAAPSSYGVNVCTPANYTTVTSPVQLTATANIIGTLARMEIWVNGGKVYTETTSTQLSHTLTLAAGTYKVDVYAANTQGTLWETTTNFTVH